MASSLLPRLLERRFLAATSYLRPLHALSSLRHLHFSSHTSHDPNPSSNPSLPKTHKNESVLGFPRRDFTVYPTFPYFSHLGPVSLSDVTRDSLIGAQSTPNLAVPLIFEKEPQIGLPFFASLDNVGLIPLSEAIGLEIEGDEDIVIIRADSVKKKRKKKMNKHKLRKLRKKLRRKT